MHEGDLIDERTYAQARADELRSMRARTEGLSRRRFLQILAAGA